MLSENPRDDMKEILFEEEQIQARVAELGAQLGADYKDKTPLMICVLRGAAFFFTDLCRRMDCKMDMDFIAVSSYGHGQASTGAVRQIRASFRESSARSLCSCREFFARGGFTSSRWA